VAQVMELKENFSFYQRFSFGHVWDWPWVATQERRYTRTSVGIQHIIHPRFIQFSWPTHHLPSAAIQFIRFYRRSDFNHSLAVAPQFDGDAIESAPLLLVDTPPKTKSKNKQTVAKIFLLLVSLILPNCVKSSGQSQAAFEDVSGWFMNLIYRFPIM
jgi:hypothetical protein